MFKVNFSDSDPVQARDVVQALLTIFVESNLGQSRKDLDSARRFIDEQIREYELELEAAEQRLAKFKQDNAGVLPGEVSYARKIDEVVAELARVDEALRGSILRRDTLRNELDQTSQFIELEASAAGGGFGPPSDVAVQIIELQQGLDELLSRYTAMHPDVQIAQRRLDALTQTRDEELQAQVENADAFGDGSNDASAGPREPNTIYEQLKLDLVEEEANVAILSDRLERSQTTVATMRGLASRVPEVEADLANLNRDYEIIQSQHDEFLGRRESAKVSRDREIKADQVQFRVVEPPVVPVGNALISTAFCVYGGPLTVSEDARAALDSAATTVAGSLRTDHLEYRLRHPSKGGWACKDDLYVTFQRALDPKPEANLAAIPRKQRAMIRKGIKLGLSSELDDDVSRFYPAYAESVRNLGTPVLPRRYFQSLKDVFGDACEVLTVSHLGTPISSVVNFHYRDQVMPYYGGGIAKARALAANDFLYWETMRRAISDRGAGIFDFGRSKTGTGSYAFKKHWGFEPQPLYYEYKLLRAQDVPDVNPLNPKYRAMIAVWKRLPLQMANTVGPIIARSLG